jgi:hypothetical protein
LNTCDVQSEDYSANLRAKPHQVTNTANYSAADWQDDIQLAQDAHIDAFALNMAYGDGANAPNLAAGYAAAGSLGFHLFFSLDYAGNGP